MECNQFWEDSSYSCGTYRRRNGECTLWRLTRTWKRSLLSKAPLQPKEQYLFEDLKVSPTYHYVKGNFEIKMRMEHLRNFTDKEKRKYYEKICPSVSVFPSPYQGTRDSSVGIATRYGLDDPRIESRWGGDFPHPSRPALRPTQAPTQWVPGLSRG